MIRFIQDFLAMFVTLGTIMGILVAIAALLFFKHFILAGLLAVTMVSALYAYSETV